MRRALYPGTFDPFTYGHLDVVRRAAELFDGVVIGVSENPGKSPLFAPEERVAMVREALGELPAVRVIAYGGLTVDCAEREGCTVLVRGLRTTSDLESELQQAMMNREMVAELQTVFLPAQASRVYLSSSILKEVARYGRDISAFVPEPVARRLKEKLHWKVDETLDRMEYVVHHARHVPFSSQVMVDEDEIMDLIDQLRFNLPEEIKKANWTVQEQQRLIAEAHGEAGRILATANERAEVSVQDHEITRRAKLEGQRVVADAQVKADQTIRDAEAYTSEQLQNLEAHLSRTLVTVRRGIEALQAARSDAEDPELEESQPQL